VSRMLLRPCLSRSAFAIQCNSACVVEDDFPSVGTFAPDEGEDAVVLGGFAVLRAVEVEFAGDQGDVGFAAA
jgi:hypothetical protein